MLMYKQVNQELESSNERLKQLSAEHAQVTANLRTESDKAQKALQEVCPCSPNLHFEAYERPSALSLLCCKLGNVTMTDKFASWLLLESSI